jgi:hypothetical protein
MKVLLDNGIYRHLHFKNSDPKWGFNQWFEIVTWPGYLSYSGDMGCFVFSRLTDMFEFFRHSPLNERESLYINIDYWAEKLEAVDRLGGRTPGAEAFSAEKAEARIHEEVNQWIEDYSLSKKEQTELRVEIQNEVLWALNDSESELYRALREFSYEIKDEKLEFQDSWEWDLKEYTGRFIWCCYALAWGIRQYDKAKQIEEVADACV